MMDTNTINPQTDKLHRFLVTPKSHEVSIDVTNEAGEYTSEFDVFRMAIAQAFGMGVDKSRTEDVMAFADELLKADVATLEKALEGEKVEIGGVEVEVEHLSHFLVSSTLSSFSHLLSSLLLFLSSSETLIFPTIF